MIRNYNGNVNRAVIRDLRRLCDVNAENERNLFEIFNQKGKVSVYENLDPFLGCPDELSTVVTMKSEAEVKEYLRKDFIRRVEGYLDYRQPAKDYLMCALIEFIKENGRFPEKETMSQLEKEAEKKRIAELTTDIANVSKKITEQDIAKEILELAEEIMEAKRENNPEDIFVPVEPYPERFSIETNSFYMGIMHDIWYGCKDFRDYKCAISMKDFHDVAKIVIGYYDGGTLYITAENFWDEALDVSVTNYLIDIHKSIVKIAEETGIEFTSEIDYEQF